MYRERDPENDAPSFRTWRHATLALVTALLVAGAAQTQTWTGAEVLTSGDWIEMSYAAGPNGARTYVVDGTSLRWVAGFGAECAGNSSHGGRCIADRSFRLPLPAACSSALVGISYQYTNEGSPGFGNDNEFLVGIGSATRVVHVGTGDNNSAIVTFSFSNLDDPDFNGQGLLALDTGTIISPIPGTEASLDATFDLRAGSTWDVSMTATSSFGSVSLSGTETLAPPAGEMLYVFLVSGDRYEQYLLDFVEITCFTPADLVVDLVADVMALDLPQGLANSLEVKLDAALRALDDDNQNNDVAACNALQAFINEISARRGVLLSEGEAEELIGAAQQIMKLLGCIPRRCFTGICSPR